VYDREYDGNVLTLEASGGLINSTLVMQDRETDTFWSLMSEEAVAGKLKGTKLEELPVGQKMQWKDWVKLHPDTEVLSVDGKEDAPNVYEDYFSSALGFRHSQAEDKRLATKQPIFAFQYKNKPVAVPHQAIEGGKVFDTGSGDKIFFYRPKGAPMFFSTIAYVTTGKGFEKNEAGQWQEVESGCLFNPETGSFEGDNCTAHRLGGFDTFWYNWSLNHPDTAVLGGGQ